MNINEKLNEEELNSKKDNVIIVRVSAELKNRFKKLCKKERRTESDLLRILIEDKLDTTTL